MKLNVKKIKWSGFISLLLLAGTLIAQTTPLKVTGRVTDVKGEFLIGVSVFEKGTQNGTDRSVRLQRR